MAFVSSKTVSCSASTVVARKEVVPPQQPGWRRDVGGAVKGARAQACQRIPQTWTLIRVGE